METEKKVEEAEYFFNQMKENLDNPKVLGFNLSAFINASRSITFFMQKEHAANPRFKPWYESKQNEMKEDTICKFIKELRTANIHFESPKTSRDITVPLTDSMSVSDSISVKVIRNGRVIQDSPSKTTETKKSDTMNLNTKKTNPKSTINIKMYFKEKPEEDGISLCESYLSKMKNLVSELSKVNNNNENVRK